MLLHHKINKRFFSPSRLVFEGPDKPKPDVVDTAKAKELSKTSLDTAVSDLVANNDDKAADKIVETAKGKINAIGDTEANKATRDEAIRLLEANRKTLDAAKKYIGDRVAAKLVLDDYDKQKDFLGKGAALKKLEATAAALRAYKPTDDLVGKYDKATEDHGKEAATYYNGLKLPEASLDLSQTPLENLQGYLTKMSAMQKAKFEGFPGLEEAAKADLEKKFVADMGNIQTALEKSAATTDPDLKRQMDMYAFANKNLEGAQKETDNTGHLAGAKEYMEMVLTEQEARGIWEQLPSAPAMKDSWRSGSIETPIGPDSGWTENGVNQLNYNNAVKLFKQAKELSANRVTGDSVKAKDLFKQSADTFRLVLANALSDQTEKDNGMKAAATEKKNQIDAYLKDNAVDTLAADIQAAWADGKGAFDKGKFKNADAQFALVTAEIERLGGNLKAVETATATAKSNFETKYGSDAWAASVKGQADAIANQMNRSGVTESFRININKDIARIYNEAGPAIDANRRVMTAFKEGGNVFDRTAKIIYDDATWRFDRGNFKDATQKLNEAADIYENRNKNPDDRKKSMAIIDGKLQEGTEELAKTAKTQAEAANTAALTESPNLAKLLKFHLDAAAIAMGEGYWARAINQYQQVIDMKKGSDATAELYLGIADKVKPGEDAYDLIQQGNKYYNNGSFAEAKTYYENAKKAYQKDHPEIAVATK